MIGGKNWMIRLRKQEPVACECCMMDNIPPVTILSLRGVFEQICNDQINGCKAEDIIVRQLESMIRLSFVGGRDTLQWLWCHVIEKTHFWRCIVGRRRSSKVLILFWPTPLCSAIVLRLPEKCLRETQSHDDEKFKSKLCSLRLLFLRRRRVSSWWGVIVFAVTRQRRDGGVIIAIHRRERSFERKTRWIAGCFYWRFV